MRGRIDSKITINGELDFYVNLAQWWRMGEMSLLVFLPYKMVRDYAYDWLCN